MPIFGRQKDRHLIKHFSTEVLQDILDTPVIIYKPYISRTNTNIYGEGTDGDKNYRAGVVLYAAINREDQEWSQTDLGVDITQKGTFAFLNEHIWGVSNSAQGNQSAYSSHNSTFNPTVSGEDEEDGFAIEIGDLIYYDSQYWEIDTTIKNQYLSGRNQNVMTGDAADLGLGAGNEWKIHGESLSTVAAAHITRRSKINVEIIEPVTTVKDGSGDAQGLYR
tara:strand:- start:399 stop:1061 length:663 start_codon:yes stop_codon:yes gene_type:complete